MSGSTTVVGLREEMNGTEARWINTPAQSILLYVSDPELFTARRLEMEKKKKERKPPLPKTCIHEG